LGIAQLLRLVHFLAESLRAYAQQLFYLLPVAFGIISIKALVEFLPAVGGVCCRIVVMYFMFTKPFYAL
jgi:uncharacterized membrane protein